MVAVHVITYEGETFSDSHVVVVTYSLMRSWAVKIHIFELNDATLLDGLNINIIFAAWQHGKLGWPSPESVSSLIGADVRETLLDILLITVRTGCITTNGVDKTFYKISL